MALICIACLALGGCTEDSLGYRQADFGYRRLQHFV